MAERAQYLRAHRSEQRNIRPQHVPGNPLHFVTFESDPHFGELCEIEILSAGKFPVAEIDCGIV